MAESADVAIVGGGISGLALAWELARLGIRSLIMEQSYTGAGGSGRNVGRIRAMQLTRPQAEFSIRAKRKHDSLSSALGANTLLWNSGYAWVFYDTDEIDRVRDVMPMLVELGIAPRVLDAEAAQERLPVLRGGERLAGAVIGRGAIIHHDAAVFAYRRALERLAIPIHERRKVTAITTAAGAVSGLETSAGPIQASIVVNATGGWGQGISALAGIRIPVTCVRREVLVTAPTQPFMREAISFYRPVEGWFNQTLRGEVVAGVTDIGEPAGLNHRSSFAFLVRTASLLARRAPRLGHLTVIRQWAGVYDLTPDRYPLVGFDERVSGFVQMTGFGARGFAFAPICAELLARWIKSGDRPEDLVQFDPNRFSDQDDPQLATDYYAAYAGKKVANVGGEPATRPPTGGQE